MTDDIQFGELEHTEPHRALRPDENRQFAVAPLGNPSESDLPIYIDLDVHAELDRHADSDTSVELGGVLLGRACHDPGGRAFVVVTDCIRAKHYESTQGSFKFTHDTWSAITRERQRAAPDLQIVGWYHTHPGWGIFLSGMDLFICENFFTKPLDIAYVIDPCRRDRGMFQWTDASSPDNDRSVRRTGGYHLFASRFRSAELTTYLAELNTMPAVQTNQQPQMPSWQSMAILGMLTAQLLLIAILAWKVLVPPPSAAAAHDRDSSTTADKLTTALNTLEDTRRIDLAEERLKARTEFLDQAFRELKGTDENAISRLQSRFDHSARLTDDVAARDARLRELETQLGDSRDKLLALETSAKHNESRLTAVNESLRSENAKLLASNQPDAQARDENRPNSAASTAANADSSNWLWIVGSVLAFVTLVAIARHFAGRPNSPSTSATI